MLSLVTTALVMGLSASTYCLTSCVPVLFPYAGTVERPSFVSGISLAALFSIGRLVAYSCLALAFVLLREFTGVSSAVISVSLVISGLLLLLSALVAFGAFRNNHAFDRILCRHIAGAKSPLYLGLLTGIKPCGPLLAAMAFVLTIPNKMNMSIFMLVFWLTSSLVLLALGGVGGGLMSFLAKRIGTERMRRIAAVSMVVIGVVLVTQGIGTITNL